MRARLRRSVRGLDWVALFAPLFLVIHDVVISAPARGGYGLPTAYFLLQGIGVIAERRWFRQTLVRATPARRIGQHLWTLGIAAGPAFWLFHPAFVRRVFVPFLAAVGSLEAGGCS